MIRPLSFFREAVRNLRGSKLYAVSVVGIVGVVLAATATVGSLNALLLYQGLPYNDQASLVDIQARVHTGTQSMTGNSPAFSIVWKEELSSLGTFSIAQETSARVRVSGADIRVGASYVSPEFFSVLEEQPAGRGFDQIPSSELGDRVVVVSDDLGKQIFGSDKAPVDQFVQIDGEQYRIVGVTRKDFRSPRALAGESESLWLPLIPSAKESGAWRNFNSSRHIYGRLKSSANLNTVQSRLEALTTKLVASDAAGQLPRDFKVFPETRPLRDAVVGDSHKASMVMLAATIVLALLGLSIVATMLIARWAARKPVLAMHVVLGARTADIRALVAAEIIALVMAATILAIPLSVVCIHAVRLLAADKLPRLDELSLSPSLLGWLGLCSFLTAATISIAASRQLRSSAILDEIRNSAKGGIAAGRLAYRQALLTFQLFLLIAALYLGGLILVDSGKRLLADPGYSEEASSFTQIELPETMRSVAAKKDLEVSLQEAMLRVDGVESVALVDMPPVSSGLALFDVRRPDNTPIAQMLINGVGMNYLDSIGMTIRQGRLLDAADYHDHPDSIVLGEAAASLVANSGNALGQRVAIDGVVYTVVGVVNDVVNPVATMEGARLQGYVPFQHYDGVPSLAYFLFGSSTLDKAGLTKSAELINPHLVVEELLPTSRLRGDLVAEYYVKAAVSIALILLATTMAASGIYAVVGYLFHLMKVQLAVQLAIGARWSDLVTTLTHMIRTPLLLAIVIFSAVAWWKHSSVIAYFGMNVGELILIALCAVVVISLFVLVLSRWMARRLLQLEYRDLLASFG